MKPEDRLRKLDLLRPPDQWTDIVQRRPRPRLPDRAGSRVATIALALAVAAAGVGLAAAAFLGDPEPIPPQVGDLPTASPEESPAPYPSPERYRTHSDSWGDPRALHVTCREGKVVVGSTEVPAQPDGVHILVRNPEGSADGFTARLTREGTWPSGYDEDFGARLETGVNRILFALPPGPALVGCWAQGHGAERVEIDVRDPRGWWVPNELACENTIPFVRPVDRGAHPDVETAMRTDVPGVQPGDEIVKTGYPLGRDWPGPWTMLVVRDGEPVASIIVVYVEDEGWVVFTGGACPGSGIQGRGGHHEAG